ncbi:MAG TPA: class I SAM-dependent methyltransferase [Acidimicrobiales bacterium]|nr:class I SAM-dependent methyltransferase [Acidimicrobiales bacterium]
MSPGERVTRWSRKEAPAPEKETSGRYATFWRPPDVSGAMKSIFNGDDADEFERSGREQAEILAAHLASEDAIVVDIGCGIGRVARHMAPRCKLLWAVDVSDEMLAMAAERLADRPNVRFARCADTRIPDIADSSVDFVYSILVLQHLEREDAFLMLREIHRILRPGATAYLTFPNLLSDVYLQSFVTYAESGEAATNPVRARVYTPQEVERLLPVAGLTVTSLEAGVEIVVLARKDAELPV